MALVLSHFSRMYVGDFPRLVDDFINAKCKIVRSLAKSSTSKGSIFSPKRRFRGSTPHAHRSETLSWRCQLVEISKTASLGTLGKPAAVEGGMIVSNATHEFATACQLFSA